MESDWALGRLYDDFSDGKPLESQVEKYKEGQSLNVYLCGCMDVA